MKTHLYKVVFTAIIFFVVQQTAFAQWQSLTLPSQGSVSALAVLHGNLYASLGGLLYRSTDNGAHWALDTVGGLGGNLVTTLQADGDNLIAGTNKTVFLSSDDGGSWLDLIAGFLADFTTTSLAADGNVIIASTAYGAMAITTDLGTSWSNQGVPDSVNALTGGGGKFFAATILGVVLTQDSGGSWGAVNNGLWNNGIPVIRSIAVDGNYLFAGATNGRGVFYSIDNGTNWTATQSAGMGVDSHGKMRTVNCFLANGGKLFAGTEGGGFYVSGNYGANWIVANTGLTDTSILAMAVTASDLFIGTEKGVWRRSLSEISAVKDAQTALPSAFDLQQNFPNPFSSISDIAFSI